MADALEEHVTCSICLGLYDDPLALPCMHSFCRRCIQGIVASSMCLKCPECRKDIKLGKNGVAGLAKNFQLGCIVSSYKENMDNAQNTQQSNTHLPLCTVHKSPCPLECRKCRTAICLQCVCSDQHATHPFSITDDNQDQLDGQSDIYCDKHERQYRLYCKTCQSLVCLKCLTTKDHTKHLYSAIETTYEHRKMLLEGRLKECEKQHQLTRTNWKTYRDFAQKTQTDAQRKRDQLTNYFTRLRDTLDRKEREMKAELDGRERRVLDECKRKIDEFQTTEQKLNSAARDIKQLLTEERLRLLKTNSNYERIVYNNSISNPSFLPSTFEDASLVACQFEKEIKTIRWDWPKQVPDRLYNIEPTAPPVDTTIQPVPRPRRRQSQTDRQLGQSQQQYYQQQQHNQQQVVSDELGIGSIVQRGKHWKAAMEDGGPGHMGTVVQTTVDPHVYIVRWPNGRQGSYAYNPPWKEEIIPP